jgi:hypothetical protein
MVGWCGICSNGFSQHFNLKEANHLTGWLLCYGSWQSTPPYAVVVRMSIQHSLVVEESKGQGCERGSLRTSPGGGLSLLSPFF